MYDFVLFLSSSFFNLFNFLDSIILFNTLSLLKFLTIIALFKLAYSFVGVFKQRDK